MRHQRLPPAFTLIGTDEDGKEYIQCTRTGDVLVQIGPEDWTHFASAREWRAKTAARLYPELIFLQRALKRIGTQEQIEDQLRVMREAQALLNGLQANLSSRMGEFEAELAGYVQAPVVDRVSS
jgi:hypothetical protein